MFNPRCNRYYSTTKLLIKVMGITFFGSDEGTPFYRNYNGIVHCNYNRLEPRKLRPGFKYLGVRAKISTFSNNTRGCSHRNCPGG